MFDDRNAEFRTVFVMCKREFFVLLGIGNRFGIDTHELIQTHEQALDELCRHRQVRNDQILEGSVFPVGYPGIEPGRRPARVTTELDARAHPAPHPNH